MSPAYRGYALTVLTAVYTLNLLDRGLVALLLQPIKQDLQLSDTQLGFLTGIAFALFYAVLGVPIARQADRRNRVSIAAAAIFLWGLTVMACLWVASFPQLLAARVAAAVGESGCKPPTYSLVGDYFPEPGARASAMSVYWLGSPISSLTSFILGGWLSTRFGWRMTFFIMGIPAIALAGIVKLTLNEPRRGEMRTQVPQVPGYAHVFSILWRRPSLRNLSIALVLLYAMGAGLAPWYAAFMIRSHGMSVQTLGLWFGLIFGLGGAAGALLGGQVTTRFLPNDERAQLRISAFTLAGVVPSFLAFLTLSDAYLALLALAPLMIAFNFLLGPTYALLQRLAPDDMRATSLAVIMLLANLIGMGLGPQIVGVMSDLLSSAVGANALRYAMLCMSLIAFWASVHLWLAGETVTSDLQESATALPAERCITCDQRGS